MPISARFEIGIPDLGVDARELVAEVADVTVVELRASIIGGVDPETGAQRERKADGKPTGYATGTLANGIQRGPVTGGRLRASTTIVPPASRAGYVAEQGDILTVGGIVGQAIDRTVDAYIEEAVGG